MSEHEPEAEPRPSPGDPLPDELLPEDLRPGEDNPLAVPLDPDDPATIPPEDLGMRQTQDGDDDSGDDSGDDSEGDSAGEA